MEKINIAELLKDCPEGMELDCTMFDGVFLEGVEDDEELDCPILIKTKEGETWSLSREGRWDDSPSAKCVIFPKGKTTWEGFVPPVEFKDGDIVAYVGDEGDTQLFIYKEIIDANEGYSVCYMMLDYDGTLDLGEGEYYITRLATIEEKERLFKVIKDNGYRWNAETKTLEKLIEPKFKVGDIIQDKDDYKVKITKVDIDEECYEYISTKTSGIGSIPFGYQDDWELVPDKFDITTLKPFESRVLVRDLDHEMWRPAIYGLPFSNGCYVLNGGYWCQCIPYEGNEHLLGTTNDCDEYYKIW